MQTLPLRLAASPAVSQMLNCVHPMQPSQITEIISSQFITQKFLEKVLKLHQEGYKIIVHATCTGYGGTELEPNVPDFTSQLTMIKMLLDDGFPAEQRAVRCVLFR